ncbi:ABC transporter permease [Luteimonas viscosa]|uniref:ABC transporter permease n=1 Tax=Luteimonas viscosa TaxID=1132694 RepID=A0A5D4XQR1_9GAMM|nr:ABC transporter permease [Luteimonas viscosa]TYT27038.1 ABC transporter permease [Luteimonas viscosa]
MTDAIAPTVAHTPWRAYWLEAKYELLRMLREPAFCAPVVAFPAMFYLLFGVLLNRGNAAAAEYLLASYGVFGVVGAALFGFGVTIAMDRERGYLRLRRALPTPPGAQLLAKMAMAMLFAAIISVVLALLAATAGGVSLAPRQWAGLFAVNVAGVLPFAAIGLWVGTLVGGNAAPVLLNLIYLPMAFLSGLWLPLSMLPDWLARIAPAWPAYHLGQLALKVVGHDGGGAPWLHLLVLAVVTVACFVLAQRRLAAAG